MALTASKVRVGVTGAIYYGETVATAPTASDSTLTGFTEVGYLSSDGLEFTPEKSTTAINAWQNSDLVRTVITDSSLTYKMTLIETSVDALELYFGVPVIDGKVEVNPAATGGRRSFVFDVVDDDKVIRHYVPSGEITAVEAQKYTNGEAVAYGITVTAYSVEGRSADVFYSEFEAA
jgi:hypothetical protein